MPAINSPLQLDSKKYLSHVTNYRGGRLTGKVCQVIGLVVEAVGIRPFIGEICRIETGPGETVSAEVVGFRGDRSLLMPYGDLKGVFPGCAVFPTEKSFTLRVSLLQRPRGRRRFQRTDYRKPVMLPRRAVPERSKKRPSRAKTEGV